MEERRSDLDRMIEELLQRQVGAVVNDNEQNELLIPGQPSSRNIPRNVNRRCLFYF